MNQIIKKDLINFKSKVMKKKLFLFYLITALLCFFMGCSKKSIPTVDSKPEFVEVNSQIMSLPGRTFVVKAKIEDVAGLKTINLKNDEWFLDKNINFDTLATSYDLAYNFKVPDSALEGSTHTVTLTVINKGGAITTTDVIVTLNMDIIAPTITVLSPVNGASQLIKDGSTTVSFDVKLKDENGLKYFTLKGAGFEDNVALDVENYQYVKSFIITKVGSFKFVLTATDSSDNVKTSEVIVNVIDDMIFDKMYITEYDKNEDLTSDLFGIPVLAKNSTDPVKKGRVFTAKYYAASPNTKVRFLPQKTSFEPFSFGADAENGVLALGTDATVNPIILPAVGYYEIIMDLLNRTYSVRPYTVSDTPYGMVQLVGTGVKVNGKSVCTKDADNTTLCWHFTSGKELIKDPNNPYRFTATVELFDAPDNTGVNGFLLNASRTAWNPFWRFDDGTNPEEAVLNNGAPFVFESDAYGTYHLIFDTHLNQISLIRQ